MTVIRFYGIHCNFTCVRCENVFAIRFLCEVASIDTNGLWSPDLLVRAGTSRDSGSRQHTIRIISFIRPEAFLRLTAAKKKELHFFASSLFTRQNIMAAFVHSAQYGFPNGYVYTQAMGNEMSFSSVTGSLDMSHETTECNMSKLFFLFGNVL